MADKLGEFRYRLSPSLGIHGGTSSSFPRLEPTQLRDVCVPAGRLVSRPGTPTLVSPQHSNETGRVGDIQSTTTCSRLWDMAPSNRTAELARSAGTLLSLMTYSLLMCALSLQCIVKLTLDVYPAWRAHSVARGRLVATKKHVTFKKL